LFPVILTSNQDGRQAKNKKKWDEILIVHCCLEGGHSTKVWLQLAQWFLMRRLKCEMLTD
jgi:hypothetical protein